MFILFTASETKTIWVIIRATLKESTCLASHKRRLSGKLRGWETPGFVWDDPTDPQSGHYPDMIQTLYGNTQAKVFDVLDVQFLVKSPEANGCNENRPGIKYSRNI